jgi:ornithine carbamoyltransferase
MRHYLQFKDLNRTEIEYLFQLTTDIKTKFKRYERYHPLSDRTLAMVFEKASTRTRISFEAGMYQLGGNVVHLTTGDSQLGRAESIEDTAKIISSMVDLAMVITWQILGYKPLKFWILDCIFQRQKGMKLIIIS